MPVDSKHPDYDYSKAKWSRCRAAVEGEDAIKAGGIEYLPQPTGQDKDEYENYKNRATFYGASERTVHGLTGAVFRKEMIVDAPDELEEDLKTVGNKGQSFDQIAHTTVSEVLGIGRVGVLVDAGEEEDSPPYIALYWAEDIISWRTAMYNSEEILTEVVLEQCCYVPDEQDRWVTKKETKYRVLRLGRPMEGEETADDYRLSVEDVENGNGVYWVEIWRKVRPSDYGPSVSGNKGWIMESKVVPTVKGGKPLKYIPFVFFSPVGTNSDCEKSPILDLVNLNLAWYRNSADYEHGLHFCGNPTPIVSGMDLKSDRVPIGGERAWILSEPDAKAYYLEFSGASIAAIETAMSKKERQMAILGAKLLEEQKKEAETAETTKLRQAGEQSVLSRMVDACSEGLTKVLKTWVYWLTGTEQEVSVSLSKDFVHTPMDPTLLANLMAAVQGNLMSWDTFFFNIKRADMVPDDRDVKEEAKLIIEGSPMGNFPMPGEVIEGGEEEEEEEAEEEPAERAS